YLLSLLLKDTNPTQFELNLQKASQRLIGLSRGVGLKPTCNGFNGTLVRNLGLHGRNIFLLYSLVNLVSIYRNVGGSLNSKSHIVAADAQDLDFNFVTND